MAEIRTIDVNEALELAQQGAVLLDVREPNEWEAGRSASALHIPLADLPDQLAELPRDRVIVCICRSGHRSSRATHFLTEQGFEAANLEGGMMAWAHEGKPLVANSGQPSIT
jgi:rhodanese-related sulfurtransferase